MKKRTEHTSGKDYCRLRLRLLVLALLLALALLVVAGDVQQ